jgi:hypothetical protein
MMAETSLLKHRFYMQYARGEISRRELVDAIEKIRPVSLIMRMLAGIQKALK